MLIVAVAATIHLLTVMSQVLPSDPLSQQVLARVANPLLTSAQFLIPAAVAISGIHKMMEHRAELTEILHDRHQHYPASCSLRCERWKVLDRDDVGEFVEEEAETCGASTCRIRIRQCVGRSHDRHEYSDKQARNSLG